MYISSRNALPKIMWKLAGLCVTFSAVILAGCGGGENVASVNGKVTAEGKAVTAGTLIFAPVPEGKSNPGKPAVVEVKSDGTFSSKAVVVGKSTIVYNSPSPAYPEGYTPKPSEPAPVSPFSGLIPETKEVEVKSDTTLEIKLVRKK